MGIPGANVMYDFCRLDIGKMVLRPIGKIISGTLRQDLWNAEIRGKILTDLGEVSFRALTPYDKMVNLIEVTSTEKKDGKKADYKWEFLPGNPASPRAQVFPDNAESKAYITNPPPAISKDGDITYCVQTLLAGGDYATAWKEQASGKQGQSSLFIAIANEVPAANRSKGIATQAILGVANQKVSLLNKLHRDWWHNFYQQSFLSVPDARIEAFYWIQLYKMASGTRRDGPPLDLFGPWFRVSQWPGLWWNLNIQLTYWPFYQSNHLDLSENLNWLIDEKFDALLDAAKGSRLGDFAWAMHNYWLQYSYSGDWKSIQEKWVPKAMKIAAAYEKMEQRDVSGKIGLLPMGSPEYKGFETFPNTNYNLAILRWLLNSLIESNEKFNTRPIEVSKWKQTVADLVPYPVDQNGLMIGSNQPVDQSHRHYSHLLGLYPLFQLNPDAQADRELVDKSVVHWHKIGGGKGLAGYSFTGAASLYAALGRGNDAYAILQNFLLGNIGISQLLSNTFYVEAGGRNPVIETPLSAAASTMELLLQSWGNKIRIFPAVPDLWKEASFDQLRARGGFLVSASRKAGKTEWVWIKSLAGEPCILKVNNWTTAICKDNRNILSLGNGEFKVDLKAGEELVLFNQTSLTKAIISPVKHLTNEKNIFGVKKGKQLPKDQSWPLPEYKLTSN